MVATPSRSISSPTLAELSWTPGRLDPNHPQTGKVVATIDQAVRALTRPRS
jgi:hypothetical protein